MRLTFKAPLRSITGPVTVADLPDFVVLSGPNGSGKSNLLEAIQRGFIDVDHLAAEGTPAAEDVRLVSIGELRVSAQSPQTRATFRDGHVNLAQAVESIHNGPRPLGGDEQLTPAQYEQRFDLALLNQRAVTLAELSRLKQESGKPLWEFTIDDFRRYGPLIRGPRDAFDTGIGEIFLTYTEHLERHRYARWRAADLGEPNTYGLTDQEFAAQFGPPPWDLLNDALTAVGLDYRFEAPYVGMEDVPYQPTAIHRDGARVLLEELSSGEKTLMALALSVYTTGHLGENATLPKLLLLDETDASLHPSMAQSLLRIMHDVIHVQSGVKVLLTTHAPTTVALAPSDSLYVMTREGSPRVRKASRDDALRHLTVGIPALSVSIDDRRQVFTESKYDQDCYQALFTTLRPHLTHAASLEFIASGNGQSGNSDSVKHLVSELRRRGNRSVWGVVDRDDRVGADDGIEFVPNRYAIENLLLDPLGLAVLLLRDRIFASDEMALPGGLRHYELTEVHAQRLADFISLHIQTNDDDTSTVEVGYFGGFTAKLPRFYLELRGHDLEDRIMHAFKPLRPRGKQLKLDVVNLAFKDVRDFIPQDAVDLFTRLQTDQPPSDT